MPNEIIDGLDHIAMTVKDLEKSVVFYANVLGFKKGERFDFPERKMAIQFVKSGGVQLELFGYYEGTEERQAGQRVAGVSHFALEVESLDKACEELKARGVVFEGAPRVAMMGQRIIFFQDPDGNRIELIEWPR